MDKLTPNQIIITKNTNDSKEINAITIANGLDRSKYTAMVLSLPNPTESHGWFVALHEDLIDSIFTLAPVLSCDLAPIEAIHHDIYRNNVDRFQIRDYYNDVLSANLGEVIETALQTSIDSESMLGETMYPLIAYTDITHYTNDMGVLSNNSIAKTAAEHGFKYLAFLFSHKNTKCAPHKREFGMCTFNLETTRVTSTFDPLHFFKSLNEGGYAFAGTIYDNVGLLDESGVTNDALNEALENRILNVIIPALESLNAGTENTIASLTV
jgi:hypothetical protein